MLRRLILAALVGWSAVLAAPAAEAEIRAVLVGVSDYTDESGIADLKGPANDVRLLARILEERGVEDITVLADGVEGGARPTRSAIVAAFTRQADVAGPGDLVYLHLSGHGTRQFDLDGDETDGLDEVFLPADTARAEPGSGTIPNALVDDEIGRMVDAIRATGADVWLVMDSCNSGSGLRASTPAVASRYVDPALLGVSVRDRAVAREGAVELTGPTLPGGYLAFYAAQASEPAHEIEMAETGASSWFGLFSAKLAARLDGGAPITYRQLFQAVLSDINDTAVPGAARLQTPHWEGTMIDAAVFGGRNTAGVRRFAVTGDEIAAGRVHGFGEGTLVALVADAAAARDDILGYAQMEEVAATRSVLRPVDSECVPRADAPCKTVGSLPADSRFAQVVAQPVDLVVRLAVPRSRTTGEPLGAEAAPVRALSAAVALLGQERGVAMVLDAAAFDVDVLWDGEALWFGRTAVVGETPVGVRWTPEAEPLMPLLARIARAEMLARMLDAVALGGSLLNPSPVRVGAEVAAVPIDALAEPGQRLAPERECRAAVPRAGEPVPLQPAAALKQCDLVRFAAQGNQPGAHDVNRIHIDAQYCVHAAHERIEGARAARALGPAMVLCSDCPSGYSAGEERLFAVVTPAMPNAEPLNLEGLVETCAAGGATRGAASGEETIDFLAALAGRRNTRGAFGGLEIADVWVERWTWQVLPRQEAFSRNGRARPRTTEPSQWRDTR